VILESDWQFLAWVTAGGFLVAVIVVWQMYRVYRRMQAAEEREQQGAREAAERSMPAAENEKRPKFFKRYV